MSTPPPPDRPTKPLRPARRAPVVEERVVAPAVDPSIILLRLEDAIASLRTWLAIVGLIALAAFGVALYGLLNDDSSGSTSRGDVASDSRVSQLDDRVDRLSRQLQSVRAASRGDDTTVLADRVEALERTVRTLSSDQPSSGDATQAIQELSSRVDDLSRDLEQLKQTQTPP